MRTTTTGLGARLGLMAGAALLVAGCGGSSGGTAATSSGGASGTTVTATETELCFEVADDGAGFDPSSRAHGAGFTNMNDRLGAMGGSLRVDSAPGKGTHISGAIPL